MKRLFLIAAGLSVLTVWCGCGVSDRTIAGAERRMQALIDKGVPDTSLSRARVLAYQAREAKRLGNWMLAKTSADSMLFLVAEAESNFKQKAANLQSTIESMRSSLQATRAQLTGLQARRLDSIIARADSFAAIGWVLQAEDNLRKGSEAVSSLKFCESRAKEIRPRLPGQWSCTQVEKSDVHPEVNMPKTQTFDFYPDGKATFTEKGKGRAGTHLKLDYEFISYGKWDLIGDTIFVFVNRFQRVREDSEEKFDKGGKERWERHSIAPCDSAITDGSQDRWITYSDLTVDFKQVKRY